jgi:hypothetical protein
LQPTGAPLQIDELSVGDRGLLGMCCCPGRFEGRAGGFARQRDIQADLGIIASWRPELVVSLVEIHEFSMLGVPDLPRQLEHQFNWKHWPVRDLQAPTGDGPAASFLDELLGGLRGGDRVLLHCAAGLGRTGTLAARLLIASGLAAVDAIATVRQTRPGAIESDAQEGFLLALDKPQG